MSEASYQYLPPVDQGLDILYQDDTLLVLNKPGGLLSVPGKGVDRQDSLATRVQREFPDAEVVHRLDMATSGIMLMARGKSAQSQLSKLFQQRQVQKSYIAVVDGRLEQDSGEIDLPLITDWPNRPKQKVDFEHGKSSQTRYRVLQYNAADNTTRVQLEPITGRSHQLRVHMQQLGHAIVGDRLYADEAAQAKADRLLLHAESIGFTHPLTMQDVLFDSQAPF
ncbi:MAG TPA: RluA family pseudouridine synthase [Acidiferrobacteraceae bacterium]|nr:RluA family pseudouridine synthase [Acidiferrobacteraceae bacterium]HEX19768.1 RluA family pseudouridine synthase [Acidiferrobacteraceae bacterium]